MRMFQMRRLLPAFFLPGFIIGIIYVNFIAKTYVADPGVFSEYFLKQFSSVQIDPGEYLWYLLKLRAVPVLFLAICSMTRFSRIGAAIFLLWAGVSSGIFISSSVLSLGMKGSLLCAAGIMPQFLCYLPAFLIILSYCISQPGGMWNRQKTLFTGLALGTGILLELYVNPVLIRTVLNAIF